ncbi:tripartite tricarboxylate transporter substrate binding protein [Ramlibacter sp. XY19]|uniref:tripartite tricarboxylate transporter substrate binding protein n=1 Tax=Ramlibacter paludis TaxID=2908000 RepID=UPI0023DC8546|nr:tripartite tricarboxylate transporter substrate binding protein [Ramlibacter paludis]MCG2591759.1 tripartite tricarboxylate transporter substrate binding protein [Ramlibacter paludis]
MKRILNLVATVLLATASVHAPAADPAVVTLLVPYAPGGPSDVGARRIAPELERELGLNVVVQNIAGATGAIALQKLLEAPPDGRTLVYGSQNELILVPATNSAVRYRPDEFAPVALVVRTPLALVTHSGAPYLTAEELVTFLRADPRRHVNYGSPGVGSIQHLAAAALASSARRLQWTHVPYKGVGPMLADLLGQHIDVSVVTLTGGTLDHLKSGKLRSLGVLSPARSPLAEDLATINEQSMFRQIDYSSWGGLFVSARTPDGIQEKLNHAMQRVMADTYLRARIFANGGEPAAPMTLAQLRTRYAVETANYQRIAAERQIRVD